MSERNGVRESLPIRLLVVTLTAVLVASVMLSGAMVAAAQEQPEEPGQAELRVVHASPDAPAVDVYLDGELTLENVSYTQSSDYLTVDPGTYTVAVTPAGEPDNVVFEADLEVGEGATTVVVGGEVAEGGEPLTPLVLTDDAQPADNETAVRLAHLSPDAPAVDVTVNETGAVLFDDVEYGTATEYVTVPAGDYTLEVRAATDSNDGDIVQEIDVTVEGGDAYTAVATGYLDPENAPADSPLTVVVYQDSTVEESG